MKRLSMLLILIATPALAGDSLAERLESVMQRPEYKHGRWGALVVDAEKGDVLFEKNPDQFFVPASVTKIYTCSTALAALGADYCFETKVFRRGDLKINGTLKGDLILKASGDLTMGGRTDSSGHMLFTDNDHTYADSTSMTAKVTDTNPLAGLDNLSRQIRESGIKQIDGEILVDDRLFDTAKGSGSGPDRLSPMVINDNVIDVLIEPSAEVGKPAVVKMRPETLFVKMDAAVKTGEKGTKSVVEVWRAGGRGFAVRGSIAADSSPLVRIYEIEEPALFARALFIESLRRAGVFVAVTPVYDPKGELPERDGYERLTKVAEFKSPPFSEVVRVTLKVSHNLYASTMPLLVAAREGKRTLADGMKTQGRYFRKLGLDPEDCSFSGGAGGMSADSTSARQTVKLIQKLKEEPFWPVLERGLPDLGVDGTLATVIPAGSPAKGKIHAKTGTLSWVDAMNERVMLRSKALAGVLTTERGRPLVFAFFVNDVPLAKGVTTAREGKTLGHLCELLYLHAE